MLHWKQKHTLALVLVAAAAVVASLGGVAPWGDGFYW